MASHRLPEIITWSGHETEQRRVREVAIEILESCKAIKRLSGLSDVELARSVLKGVRAGKVENNGPLQRAVDAQLALRKLIGELVTQRNFNWYLINCEWSVVLNPSVSNCSRCDKMLKEIAAGKHSNKYH